MTLKNKKILLIIPIIFLIVSNVFFINQMQKLDYKILIGIPVQSKTEDSIGLDFSKSKAIKEKTDAETILFSLINANEVQNIKPSESFPDAVISISDPNTNVTHLELLVWLNDSSIIYKITNKRTSNYKEINDTYYTTELKKIIKKHIR